MVPLTHEENDFYENQKVFFGIDSFSENIYI